MVTIIAVIINHDVWIKYTLSLLPVFIKSLSIASVLLKICGCLPSTDKKYISQMFGMLRNLPSKWQGGCYQKVSTKYHFILNHIKWDFVYEYKFFDAEQKWKMEK